MRTLGAEELMAFEAKMKGIFEEGELPYLIHWSGGNERELIQIFEQIEPRDWVFASHRSHYHYLLKGGSPARLEQLIRAGQSMFIFDPELRFYTSSVLAGTCGIAAGVAWALQESAECGMRSAECGEAVPAGTPGPKVWCFLGDGAEDEGHFYEAAHLVEGWELPCTFVIEDNDRSVETNCLDRRGAVRAMTQWGCVLRYRYQPTYPHAGPGSKLWVHFKDEAVHRALEREGRGGEGF
jgi:TPP-dependent pyruvate/acetoin dehydrogenase alpha subunit